MKEEKNVDNDRFKTLLIAEDNESNFLLLEALLKRDYILIHALDGRDAIQKFKHYTPDLILMDIKMPYMDGLTATRQIRMLNHYIPIIAISAFAFPQDKEEAINAGCSDYVIKPINFLRLKQLLQKHLFSNS